jgi:phosphoribosyl 1,2-cyclic phosphodiesterase
MVRFTVLASGSKGNSSIITGGSTRILVDAGLSCRELFRRMILAGEDPSTLDAIVITHEHSDHVNGVAVTARKLGIPVYFTPATHQAWVSQVTPKHRISYASWAESYRQQRDARTAAQAASAQLDDAEAAPGPEADQPDEELLDIAAAEQGTAKPALSALPRVEYFHPGQPFTIGDITVNPFTIPHDAADPVGFVFAAEGARLAVATDLGYISPNVAAQLQRADLILLESNHDLEMLRDGPYPWSVKQRVLSRVGHLSNDAAAQFLQETYDGQARWLILGHLSESNNLPELARMAAERALAGRACLLANRLLLASQHAPLHPIDF